MRTWGRNQNGEWQMVETDANGFNDGVYLTTLAQWLKLNLAESPFFADAGIPQFESVLTQVAPDFYVVKTQQQFAQFFASLSVVRVQNSNPPAYNIAVQMQSGATVSGTIET